MIRKLILINIFVIFFVSAAKGENWLFFIQGEKGDNRYIDLDSISKMSADTFRVTRKIEFDDSPGVASLVSNLKIDCKDRRIRLLNETIYFKKGTAHTKEGDGQFKDVNPEDMEELLLELVCSLKKNR